MDIDRAGSGDELVLPPASSQGDALVLRPLPSRSYSSSGGGGTNVVDDVDSGAGAGAPGRRLVASLEQELLYRGELHQQQGAGGGGGADRRKRRAMKNRESAERSRARKQAYLQELEQEIRLLRAENAALRDECRRHELKAAAAEAAPAEAEAPAAVTTKPTLQRTSSATFSSIDVTP